MDTDSFYLGISGDSLDEIVRPEMRKFYEADKKNWLATDKFSEWTPGLFKPEFVGTRGVWLTAEGYLVQNEALNKNRYSCKGVWNKHNDLHFQRYKDALDVFLKTRRDSEFEEKDTGKAKNVGFRVYDQGVATYEQKKLGLSAYYDKGYTYWLMVLIQGRWIFKPSIKYVFHIRPLRSWSLKQSFSWEPLSVHLNLLSINVQWKEWKACWLEVITYSAAGQGPYHHHLKMQLV